MDNKMYVIFKVKGSIMFSDRVTVGFVNDEQEAERIVYEYNNDYTHEFDSFYEYECIERINYNSTVNVTMKDNKCINKLRELTEELRNMSDEEFRNRFAEKIKEIDKKYNDAEKEFENKIINDEYNIDGFEILLPTEESQNINVEVKQIERIYIVVEVNWDYRNNLLAFHNEDDAKAYKECLYEKNPDNCYIVDCIDLVFEGGNNNE